MSSTPSLAQPAYTNSFMQTLLQTAFGLGNSTPSQPTGYNVEVLSSGSTVDQTTNVKINGYSDQYTNGNEVTTITFLATFSNTNSYQFNEVQFYTQVNGQNNLEVADFVFTSAISKPSNYVLVLSISLIISTPIEYIDPAGDLLNLCSSNCSNVNCDNVVTDSDFSPLPFSIINFIFIYLLGITFNYLQSLPNVQQDSQDYNNCLNQCFSSCRSNNPNGCGVCPHNCLSSLSSNPIAIYIVAENISSFSQLLPISIGNNNLNGLAIYICQGSVKSFPIQVNNVSLGASGSTQSTLTLSISIPAVDSNYNALQLVLNSNSAGYYSLGIFTLQTTTSPAGASFTFTVTLSQS